ncbi:MAG: hypothetical protein FWE09_08095, partial [Treponema sp.]|nr:hypothetical protein [Treponema sp.]
ERLERLPLDLQTGMDSRAAETAGIFSGLAGKVFRLYDLLRAAGHPVAAIKIGDTQVADYVADFHAMLNDLLAAYERQDTVLVGDIAEYEMAPRLRDFYGAVLAAAGGIRA